MPIGLDELVARAHHLAGVLFVEWTAVGVLLALAGGLAAVRLRAPAAREAVLLALSLAALAWFVWWPLAAAWVAFCVALHGAVERVRVRWLSVALVAVLLAALAIVPVWLVGPVGGWGRHARPFVAFATNMAMVRLYGYAFDRWSARSAPVPLGRYLLAMLFFPTFVNGPIEVPRQMDAGWTAVDGAALRIAARRIGLGCLKTVLIVLGWPKDWTSAVADMTAAPTLALWLWAAQLYVWFFLAFSAWTDVAVGLAALCGRRVPENFFSPWKAVDPADFWRRWHVSLGMWLRDYVYVPLGGNRRHRARNVLAVFLVSALWHVWGGLKVAGIGYFPPHAWTGFLLWGALNGAGVLAAGPLARVLRLEGGWVLPRRALTFLFAAFCWMPFFFPPALGLAAGVRMLSRMLWP